MTPPALNEILGRNLFQDPHVRIRPKTQLVRFSPRTDWLLILRLHVYVGGAEMNPVGHKYLTMCPSILTQSILKILDCSRVSNIICCVGVNQNFRWYFKYLLSLFVLIHKYGFLSRLRHATFQRLSRD